MKFHHRTNLSSEKAMSQNDNPFDDRPSTISRLTDLKDGKQVIVVTQAFGPNGEDLMDQGPHRFSGERGVRLRVRQGELEGDVILSPFFGDSSKVNDGDVEFVVGERCELFVPQNNEPLDEIPEMRTDEGGHYYAIFLTARLQDGETVAINDVWGNSLSRLMSESEMLELALGLDED